MIPFDLENPKAGLFTNITHHEYHRVMTSMVSNSYLGRLNKCPANAKVVDKDTDALMFGRAVHAYLLDRPQWEREFFVIPEKLNMRTNAGKEAMANFEAQNVGRQIVHPEDFQLIKDMFDAAMSNPAVFSMLVGGTAESTVIWQDEETGIWCKTKPDMIPAGESGVVLDYKTTRNAAEHPFQTSIVSYGYDRQAAMCLHGLKQATGKEYDLFGFVAQEPEVPYRTELYVLDDQFVRRGFGEYKRLLRIESHCREQNYWPNYSPTNLLDLRKVGAHTVMMPGYLSEVWEADAVGA